MTSVLAQRSAEVRPPFAAPPRARQRLLASPRSKRLAAVGLALALGSAAVAGAARADEPAQAPAGDDQDLAKKLNNPIANLISVPFKLDWDTGIGSADANRTSLFIQPVIPFSISADWNVITRTIVPIIYAQSPVRGGPSALGLGDTTQSFFFSPKSATASGWVWGAGPAMLYPTATSEVLGSGKWGAGPTFVVLKQSQGWTYGLLANQIWSFAGSSSRVSVSSTFLQPFVSYTNKASTTFGLNAHLWTVHIHATVGQLLRLGKQPVSITLGGRYYAATPAGGPGWGLRFTTTLLFPKT
jgi:hypothetical protein